MYGSVKKETYELELLQISPDTIRSIKTVEDTVKTEQDRERAAREVTPVYHFSQDVGKNRQAIAMSIFDFLIDVKKMRELGILRRRSVFGSIKSRLLKCAKNLVIWKRKNRVYA